MDRQPGYREFRLVRIGLWVIALGTGPLLLIILAASLGLTRDPNPNPIGPGLLAMFSFWPGVVLLALGVTQARRAGARRWTGGTDVSPGPGWLHSPVGRLAAGIGGLLLVGHGLVEIRAGGGRAAAAAIVVGAVLATWGVRGRIPGWFRR